jgi:hypothetical protein
MILYLAPFLLFLEPAILKLLFDRQKMKSEFWTLFAWSVLIGVLRLVVMGILISTNIEHNITENFFRSSLDRGHEPFLLDLSQVIIPSLLLIPLHAFLLSRPLKIAPAKMYVPLLLATLIGTVAFALFINSIANQCFAMGGC